MKVYGLIGKSGTGKSFQAIGLCEREGIECIIDDGLFIKKGTVLAGISAKRQATKVGAIKTALFSGDDHCGLVMQKIKDTSPATLLVIGTSDRMIDQITERLCLPKASERIYIESLTTEDERKLASFRRNELGQHIIPAPTLAVKRDFSGYFIHPLRIFKDMREGRAKATERSVVRPTFSYFGSFSISDRALKDIIHEVARYMPSIASIPSIFVRKRKEGIIIDAIVVIRAGDPILEAARALQAAIIENIEEMTAMNVLGADIDIKDLKWRENES